MHDTFLEQFQSFNPPWWLSNAHAQTVYASLFKRTPLPPYRRELINLPDGDVIAADWLDGDESRPLFVLIHGMEGDSNSRYTRLLMNEAARKGWTGVVLNMRSCGGLLNKKPTFYHAGFYQDIQYFMDQALPERMPGRQIYIAGVSLGGSQLVHYLAKGQPSADLKAAVLISAPLDLRGSADYMESGLNRLYIYKFRRTLLQKYRAKSALIDNPIFEQKLARAKNFWDLDGAATAPMHGFEDAADYYHKMSAKNVLPEITKPTLYLASRDDPFIPPDSMPERIGEIPALLTEHGGHVGFIDHSGESWMVPTVFQYFENF
ncbi:MAG: alpha/beta fold hydrolase [Candidatus Marinimicrobia bacterium]|nr:alpha/beta fold hydrolase [Candidatus Neomarinimicrobiota bacterium]